MRKNKFIIFGAVTLLLFGFFLTRNFVQAGDEGDAIAVRIIPNPDHYRINEWYEKQGFTGSPQSLIVDGYEAIRDGRTVYVGAANLKGNFIYTNVYLISYNQSSSNQTVDILGQIVKKWKFNTELENDGNSYSCSVSSLACSSSADCSTGQTCATSGISSSSCQLSTAKNCLLDSDCPDNFFCESPKAKIIRDLDRIGTVGDLNSSLEEYKKLNNTYPKLEAGTYLTNYTVSVWPSWTETFLSGLNLNNFKDPINRLGACPGYDPITCWNKDTKKFVYSSQLNSLVLPVGSYGLVYKTDSKGSDYQLCSIMETKKLGYTFTPSTLADSSCVEATGVVSGGTFTNIAPKITDIYLIGEPNKEFNGSIKVVDAEGNPLTWSLNTSASSWAGWSAAPILKDTNMSNVKKIYAAKAGAAGNYNLSLTISDGQGGVTVTSTPVVIMTSAPLIEAEDIEFTSSVNNNSFEYGFYVSSGNIDSAGKFYSVVRVSGPDDISFTDSSVKSAGENRYQIIYSKTGISASVNLTKDINHVFRITVWDKNSVKSTKDFKITLKADNPSLIFNCQSSNRILYPYACLLGPISQNGHTISYLSLTNLPAGLSINTVSSNAYLSGTSSAIFDNNIIIKATNEYSLAATSSLPLKINNYCGDGVKQWPNTENSGGLYNDGYEDCDGLDGIIDNAASSSISNQYGCMTEQGLATPFPILGNSYCVYKSPIEGGGYCGDGYCQIKVGDKQVEDACNCPSDCLSATTCCGDGVCTQTLDGLPAENACNCAKDCSSLMSCCGDKICTKTLNGLPAEDLGNCPGDCLSECGDGLVNGNEVCDPKAPPKDCADTFSEGLPAYCGNIPVIGTQTCNSTCSAWEACKIAAPVAVSKTYDANCSYGNANLKDYACCELTACAKDTCGCCGRTAGATVSPGFGYLAGLSPCDNLHNTVNEIKTAVGNVNSCKISQNYINERNWEVEANHAVASYRCWK